MRTGGGGTGVVAANPLRCCPGPPRSLLRRWGGGPERAAAATAAKATLSEATISSMPITKTSAGQSVAPACDLVARLDVRVVRVYRPVNLRVQCVVAVRERAIRRAHLGGRRA